VEEGWKHISWQEQHGKIHSRHEFDVELLRTTVRCYLMGKGSTQQLTCLHRQ